MNQEREGVMPVRPEDVASEKLNTMPDQVIQSFNELITQNYSGNRAIIRQDSVVALMVKKGLGRSEIYKNGWLDVEYIYRKAGWKVEYDKPGYNESYEPTFSFSRKRQNVDEL